MAARPEATRPRGSRSRWAVALASLAIAVTGVVLVVVSGGGSNSDSTAVAGPDPDPDPALGVLYTNFDGTTATLEAFVGEPLVVNFFASWCTPCLAELPEFEAVAQSLDGRVRFVGLNLQDRPETGLAVIEQTGITYDVARDPDGSVFTAFEALGMPTTVFIDGGGQVRQVWSGQLTGDALAELIDELLL